VATLGYIRWGFNNNRPRTQRLAMLF